MVDLVGQGNVSGGAEAADVGAVFILHSEQGPDASAADFGEADEEAEHGRVLYVFAVDGVEYPIEAQDGVEDHGYVVDPGILVSENIAEEWVFSIVVAERPVHGKVPHRCQCQS